jgi:hypothetical protein
MIYTDSVHLITDGKVSELHKFAESIGLKRCWFHGTRKGHPHYDITSGSRLRDAVNAGAKLVGSHEIVTTLLKGKVK